MVVNDSAEFLGSMYYAMVLRAVNDFLTDRRRLPDPERLVTLFLGDASPCTPRRHPQHVPVEGYADLFRS